MGPMEPGWSNERPDGALDRYFPRHGHVNLRRSWVPVGKPVEGRTNQPQERLTFLLNFEDLNTQIMTYLVLPNMNNQTDKRLTVIRFLFLI